MSHETETTVMKTTDSQNVAAVSVEVLVIGAGLGGLGATAKLLRAGHKDVVVLEAGEDVGGVWRINKYPNVACDTPIDLYAYSFFTGDTWTTNFAPGKEIQAYLKRLSDHFGVTPRISFNTRVVSAVWSETSNHWTVTSTDGRQWIARYVVWAGGLFSQPLKAVSKGVETFTGLSVHSTEWHEGIDLKGKRVAVVGGGATSIQVVPYVQEHAKSLIAFVRTPSYVSPRPDIVFAESERGTPEFVARLFERRKDWFERFEVLTKTRFPMNDKLVGEQEAAWKELFHTQVKDPHAREVLTPQYRYGCKRPLFSSMYYPAVTQPNVTLVGRGVSHVDGDCIVDAEGERYPVDVIVWATGFNTVGMLNGIDIRGRDGRELAKEWDPVPKAYFGTLAKGFPNLFVIAGPNTGSPGTTDIMEGQIDLLIGVIEEAEAMGATSVEVDPHVFDDFNEDMRRRGDASVLVLGNCNSYYRVGGDGQVYTHWPDTMASFATRIANEGLAGVRYAGQKAAA